MVATKRRVQPFGELLSSYLAERRILVLEKYTSAKQQNIGKHICLLQKNVLLCTWRSRVRGKETHRWARSRELTSFHFLTHRPLPEYPRPLCCQFSDRPDRRGNCAEKPCEHDLKTVKLIRQNTNTNFDRKIWKECNCTEFFKLLPPKSALYHLHHLPETTAIRQALIFQRITLLQRETLRRLRQVKKILDKKVIPKTSIIRRLRLQAILYLKCRSRASYNFLLLR